MKNSLIGLAAAGDVNKIKELILDRNYSYLASINEIDSKTGRPILGYFCTQKGNIDYVKILLDSGAEINAQDF